jgi:hypothetical protein
LNFRKCPLFFFFFIVFTSFVLADSFIDDTQAEFDLGTYNNTYWNGTSVTLNYTNESKELSVPDGWFDTDGLIGYYKLNGNADDSSPVGNDGTLSPYNATQVSGKLADGYRFNYSSDARGGYINLSEHPEMNDSNRSISMWFKIRYSGNFQGMYWDKGAGNGLVAIYMSVGQITSTMRTENSEQANYVTTLTYDDDDWHLITSVFDISQKNTSVYIDGYLLGNKTNTLMEDNITLTNGVIPVIGSTALNYLYTFNGSLDEVSIWNRTLLPTEINEYYNRTKGQYTTVGNYKKTHNATAVDWGGMIVNKVGGVTPSYIFDTNTFTYTLDYKGIGDTAGYTTSVRVDYEYPSNFLINISTVGMEYIKVNWTSDGIAVIDYSTDNSSDWTTLESIDQANNEGYQNLLTKDTMYYFRAKNETTMFSYINQRTEGGNEDPYFYFYIAALLVCGVLIWITNDTGSPFFAMFGGILSTIIAVGIIKNMFPNLTNVFLKTSLVIILVGIGFYLILKPITHWLEEIR